MKPSGISLWLVLMALAPCGAQAQIAIGADVGLYSDYVWRGLTYTNRFVIQPDAYVATTFGGTAASAGVWANVEPGQYDGATDISEAAGLAGPDLTEWNWWVELGGPAGRHRVAGGITGYQYPNEGGRTSDLNTIELYGRTQLALPLRPRISLYWDIDHFRGLYAEGSLMQPLPVSPRVSLELGALAGFAEGLAAGNGAARYASDGLTHLDFSLATTLRTAGLSIRPALHLQVSTDDATQITRRSDCGGPACPLYGADTKIWFGARVSWYRPLNVR